MTVHQAPLVQQQVTWGVELLAATLIGAGVLFAGLVAAGHVDLLPTWANSAISGPAGTEAFAGKLSDDRVIVSRVQSSFPGKAADDLIVP